MPDEPPPQVHRIVGLEVPDAELGADLDRDGSIDNRAALILAAAFRAYGGEALIEQWQDGVAARLAELSWTIETSTRDGELVLVDDVALPLGALADLGGAGDEPGWLDAVDARVTVRGDTLVLAGALPDGYAPIVAHSFLPYLNERLAAGDTTWGALADRDGDGALTVDELLADRLFQILLAPDLPDGALSFAFALHAR